MAAQGKRGGIDLGMGSETEERDLGRDLLIAEQDIDLGNRKEGTKIGGTGNGRAPEIKTETEAQARTCTWAQETGKTVPA